MKSDNSDRTTQDCYYCAVCLPVWIRRLVDGAASGCLTVLYVYHTGKRRISQISGGSAKIDDCSEEL